MNELADPRDLVVDSEHLYVTQTCGDRDAGQILRVSKAGGAVTVLATGQSAPAGLGVDEESVYWTDYLDYILAVPKTGGEVRVLHRPAEATEDLIRDGGEEVLARLQAIQSSQALVLSSDSPPLRRIAVTSECVYWVDASGSLARVFDSGLEAPEEGLAPPAHPLAVDLDAPSSLAVDGEHVYFTEFERACVSRVSMGGGRRRTCAAGEKAPLAVGSDDAANYWTTAADGDDRSGCLRRLFKG